MKNRINTAKSRLFASHELYSVVKDQDYQVLAIDAEIDTFGVTIILSFEPYNNNPVPHRRFLLSGTPNITFTHSLNVSPQID